MLNVKILLLFPHPFYRISHLFLPLNCCTWQNVSCCFFRKAFYGKYSFLQVRLCSPFYCAVDIILLMPNFCWGRKPAYLVTVSMDFFFFPPVFGILCVEDSWKLFHLHSAKGIRDANFGQKSFVHASPDSVLSTGKPRVNKIDVVPALTGLRHNRNAQSSCTLHSSRGPTQRAVNDDVYLYYNNFPAGDNKMS